MKKIIYYASPFVLFPIICVAYSLLDKIDIINLNILAVFLCVILFVTSAFLGNLSLTKKKFDYLMTIIVPISFLLTLFIALFFDEGCDGKPQLSLHHALNIEYYKVWLPRVAVMAVITFVASFKPIRISKRIWKKRPESIKLRRYNAKDTIWCPFCVCLGTGCFARRLCVILSERCESNFFVRAPKPRFAPFDPRFARISASLRMTRTKKRKTESRRNLQSGSAKNPRLCEAKTSTIVPNKRRQQATALQKILYIP